MCVNVKLWSISVEVCNEINVVYMHISYPQVEILFHELWGGRLLFYLYLGFIDWKIKKKKKKKKSKEKL